jgi:hypothetical protein
MRALDLQYDQLEIGADLSALLFAYINKIPVVYNKRKPPYEYPREDGYENKTELWDFCIFNLALHGYIPVGDKVHSIRVEEEYVKITTKNNFLIIFTSFIALYLLTLSLGSVFRFLIIWLILLLREYYQKKYKKYKGYKI